MAKVELKISITIDSKNLRKLPQSDRPVDLAIFSVFEMKEVFNEIEKENVRIAESIRDPNSKGLMIGAKTDKETEFNIHISKRL